MELSATLIIIIITVITSIYFFQDERRLLQVTFSPYDVKQNNSWYRFLTHALVHADYVHLFVNMYVLYSFGTFVEYFLAQKLFLILYIGGTIIAAMPSFLKHQNNPNYMSLGASGAVASVVFAAILIEPSQNLFLMGILPIPAWIFGILYLVFEAYMDKKSNDNIAHDAHFYGAVWGIIFTGYLDFSLITSFFDKIF
jgi:membrane associated rhomboid family serine protease